MKYPVALLFLMSVLTTSAQKTGTLYDHAVSVSSFKGKKFRIEAHARVDGVEADASARLRARLNNVDPAQGILESAKTRVKEWTQLNIEGVISADTDTLYIGLGAQYNGTFYFDDVRLLIETKKNKWAEVYVVGFEAGIRDFQPAGYGKNDLYHAKASHDVSWKGKSSLAITGSGVPNWGVNDKVGKFAEVNGVKLYYEVYGEGKPLVVLHGNGGSISNASSFYPKLITRYKVIAVDSRGHGKSSDTNEAFSYEQMAADVNALLDQLQIDSACLWGQSDGAILSFILAMDYPKKVKRAVAFGGNVQPDSSAVHPWAVDYVVRVLNTSKDPHERKLVQLMKDNPHIDYSKLNQIQAPFLLMSGDRDVIRLEHTVKIFQHIPKSHLCVLPGSTHGGAWERQELFFQLMTDFFDKPFRMPDTRNWFE